MATERNDCQLPTEAKIIVQCHLNENIDIFIQEYIYIYYVICPQ